MPNQYDRILKENVDFLAPIIAKWRGVDMTNHEILKDKLQATLENEVDFCAKILHDNSDFNEIFHVEFQSQPQYSPRRGRLYNAFLGYLHNLPVRQIVVYMGSEPHNIPSQLIEPQISYTSEIISIKDFSYRYFLNCSTPEEMIMAILADLEGEDAEKIIIKILKKIRKFSPVRASICAVQMQVLSNLRGLQNTVTKILEKMPLAIDLSKDPFFSKAFARAEKQGEIKGEARGEAIGRTKGEAIGEARGEARGVTKGEAKVIASLLKSGRFPIDEIAIIAEVPLAFVLDVQKQLENPKKQVKNKKK
jgi:predicted transposase YdaD